MLVKIRNSSVAAEGFKKFWYIDISDRGNDDKNDDYDDNDDEDNDD